MSDEDGFRVIMKGEFATLVSSWTEYLCLAKRGDGYVLMRCGYEILAPVSDYAVVDESGDVLDYELPEEIDGQAVVGVEDGEFVIGGELVPQDDDAKCDLDPEDLNGVRDWLALHEWDRRPGFEEAWREIRRIVGTG